LTITALIDRCAAQPWVYRRPLGSWSPREGPEIAGNPLPLTTCDRQHRERIRNDKSPSRLMSAAHLIYTALLVESQSVALPKAPSKKCGGIALAGIDREYRRGLERCRSIPQSHSEVTFQYQRSMPLENWIGPVPSY